MIHSIAIENLQNSTTIQHELETDEAFLVAECLKGNRLAQKVLYESHYPKLLGVCIKYLGSQVEAEDVLHDCFIKIFKIIGKFSGNSKLGTWLTRVVINDTLQYLRKKKRLKFETTSEFKDDYVDEISEDEIRPYNIKQVLQLMKQMPDGFRTVLCLYSIDGFSHKEIAEQLGISVSSSRSQLSRGRQYLKELLNRKEVRND